MALPLVTSAQRYQKTRGGTATDRLPVVAADFNPLVTAVNDIIDGTTSLTEVEVGNGTAAAPSMTFTSDPDTGIYRVGVNDIGVSTGGVLAVDISTTVATVAATIQVVSSNTTDSTTKDTGSIITEGGIGVEKAIFAGTTINAGTVLTVGTNQTFAKEVNHTVSVVTTTTAATVGGTLQIDAGAGATTGNGGPLWLNGGASGAGATGIFSFFI